MKFETQKNNYFDKTRDICITSGSKSLTILYAGNLDLYWAIKDHSLEPSMDKISIDFEITKENYLVYLEFEKLFENIKNINIFDDEEINEYERKRSKHSYYSELFDGEKITWYSDETNKKVANYVEIRKCEDSFKLSFHTQDYIEGYERDSEHFDSIAIRFRNSGSRYDPFNILFMKMYKELQELDDVYDEGHQIHIEEYLYTLKLKNK